MSIRQLAALLLCLGAVLGSAVRAQAQESVVVLGLSSVDGDDDYARNLSGALRHAASAVRGWSVSHDDPGSRSNGRTRRCGPAGVATHSVSSPGLSRRSRCAWHPCAL